MRILVIEDETTLNKNICGALLAENFVVRNHNKIESALKSVCKKI